MGWQQQYDKIPLSVAMAVYEFNDPKISLRICRALHLVNLDVWLSQPETNAWHASSLCSA